MRSVVDHVVDGIITIDARGTITTFNAAAERIFGYQSAETIGKNVKMLMPEPYHPRGGAIQERPAGDRVSGRGYQANLLKPNATYDSVLGDLR
jgi:PAS domain S-box-containing protein